jgi:hypothetical protein
MTLWLLTFTVEGVDRSALFDAARTRCLEYFGDGAGYDLEIDSRPRLMEHSGAVIDYEAIVTARWES